MAVIYLRSTDGNDADNGSTWALAKATLAAAVTAAGAGGTVYVSQAHAETQASAMTIALPGTPGAPALVLCVNDGAEPPTALTSTATVSTTGGNALTIQGSANGTGAGYIFGVTFSAGDSTNSASINVGGTNQLQCLMDTCKLVLGGSGSTSRITLNAATRSALLELRNTPMKFANAAQGIDTRDNVLWSNTPSAIDASGQTPTVLFIMNNGSVINTTLRGVDLSALGSGKSLFTPNSTGAHGSIKLINCKLGASVSALSTAISYGAERYMIENSDSADTNYRMEHYCYQGSIKSETVKVRTSGASDGTTLISWNMTSLAGASFVSPLESPMFAIWNDTAGSAKTVTVEILHDSLTALTDADIWLEVEEMGTSGYPISSIISDRKADILAAAADQTASTAAWTTTGITNVKKQKLSVTFTPQKKGYFQARVMLAKPSYTVYVDPMMVVS